MYLQGERFLKIARSFLTVQFLCPPVRLTQWIKSIFVKLFSPKILLRTRILCLLDFLCLWAKGRIRAGKKSETPGDRKL